MILKALHANVVQDFATEVVMRLLETTVHTILQTYRPIVEMSFRTAGATISIPRVDLLLIDSVIPSPAAWRSVKSELSSNRRATDWPRITLNRQSHIMHRIYTWRFRE